MPGRLDTPRRWAVLAAAPVLAIGSARLGAHKPAKAVPDCSYSLFHLQSRLALSACLEAQPAHRTSVAANMDWALLSIVGILAVLSFGVLANQELVAPRPVSFSLEL